MGRSTWRRVAIALAALAALAVPSGGTGARAPGSQLWFDRGLHVVGGPVAGPGRVIVLVAGRNKAVWLEAIDIATGAVKWKVPETFAGITQGLAIDPVVLDGVALALLPVPGDPTSPGTQLSGIEVSSGITVWRTGTIVVADAPTACPAPAGRHSFCVTILTAPGQSSLLAYPANPTRTTNPKLIKNVGRLLSLSPGLYETGATPSALAEVEVPGGIRWSQPDAKLFGSKAFDSQNGWDFQRYGPVDVGSVGVAPGKVDQLGKSKTVGIDAATGRLLWSLPGEFQCGGAVLDVPFICRMTGTATFANGHLTPSADATLTLEGVDSATGKISWHVRATNIEELTFGTAMVIDRTHLVATTTTGRRLSVDLTSGRTTPLPSAAVVWCASLNSFPIVKTVAQSGGRLGTTRFAPCHPDRGHAGVHGPFSEAVGTQVGSVFVWAEPSGLKAVRTALVA